MESSYFFDDYQILICDKSGWGDTIYLIHEDAHGSYQCQRVSKKLAEKTVADAEEPARALHKRFFCSWETGAEVVSGNLHHFLTDHGYSEEEADRILNRAHERQDNPTRAVVERVAEDFDGDYEATLSQLQSEY